MSKVQCVKWLSLHLTMAKRLGLYKTTYARYETGKCEIPFSVAIRIAKCHKVTLDYLTAIVM